MQVQSPKRQQKKNLMNERQHTFLCAKAAHRSSRYGAIADETCDRMIVERYDARQEKGEVTSNKVFEPSGSCKIERDFHYTPHKKLKNPETK